VLISQQTLARRFDSVGARSILASPLNPRAQQAGYSLPQPLMPLVGLASRAPIHCVIGSRQWQRQIVNRDRQALGEMGGKAYRHGADQVGPGDHISDGEGSSAPTRDLAHQTLGGESRVDRRGVQGAAGPGEELRMLQLYVVVERQTAVAEKVGDPVEPRRPAARGTPRV
jgi:hypothetical protein